MLRTFQATPVARHKPARSGCAFALTVLVLWNGAFAQQNPVPEEIIITGRVSGPPLWQVKNGDNTLWLFGYVTPLPEDLEFDPSSLEPVIANADEVLSRPDLEMTESLGPFKLLDLYRQYRKMRVNANDQTLDDVMPPELFARVLAAKEIYGPRGDKFFRLRPFFAALELNQEVRRKARFTDASAIGKSINRLIKRHKIPTTELVVVSDLSYKALLNELNEVSPAAELACLSVTLDRIETDIQGMKNRAQAWAYGYMAELYAMEYPDQQGACADNMLEGANAKALAAEFEQLWLMHAQHALNENHSTFSVVEMRSMLASDGLLAQLRARGYEVVDP